MQEVLSSWPDLSSKLLFGQSKNQSDSDDETVATIIRRYYLGKSRDINVEGQADGDLLDLFTDLGMSLGVAEAAQYHSEIATRPTFLYELTHRPSLSFSSLYASGTGFTGLDFGVSFSDDLFFLFHGLNRVNALRTEDDRQTSETMVKLWTNFAKYGDPTPFRYET